MDVQFKKTIIPVQLTQDSNNVSVSLENKKESVTITEESSSSPVTLKEEGVDVDIARKATFFLADQEIPSGIINAINTIFTLAHIPIKGSLHVYLNGLKLSAHKDYTLSGQVLTMINIPYPGDSFLVDYSY